MKIAIFARATAALALLSLALSPAVAGTISIKDGAGTSQSIGVTACQSGAQCYNMDTVIPSVGTDIAATVGTSAVAIAPQNLSRRYIKLQVQTPGVTCYVSTIATATADNHSLMLVSPSTASGGSGVYYVSDPQDVGTGPISVICSAAGTLVYGRQG